MHGHDARAIQRPDYCGLVGGSWKRQLGDRSHRKLCSLVVPAHARDDEGVGREHQCHRRPGRDGVVPDQSRSRCAADIASARAVITLARATARILAVRNRSMVAPTAPKSRVIAGLLAVGSGVGPRLGGDRHAGWKRRRLERHFAGCGQRQRVGPDRRQHRGGVLPIRCCQSVFSDRCRRARRYHRQPAARGLRGSRSNDHVAGPRAAQRQCG